LGRRSVSLSYDKITMNTSKTNLQSGIAFTRLPIHHRVLSDNYDLSKFLFSIFGNKFFTVVYGSEIYLSDSVIKEALEYFNDSALALREGAKMAKPFTDNFYPDFELLQRLPSGGDLLEVGNVESMNFFLSTGGTDRSVSAFSDDFSPQVVVDILENYLDARAVKYDVCPDDYLYFENYVLEICRDDFENKVAILDTSHSDENDTDMLLICPSSVRESRQFGQALQRRDWKNIASLLSM